MKNLLKKITRFFKTDKELFIEELNDYRQILDDAIKILEENIQILKLALAKHIEIGHYLDMKQSNKLIRIESINKLVTQYVDHKKDTAAREMIREKVKEQQKLQCLNEIIDMHNQRIQEYQYRLNKALCVLDNDKSNREAFIIKQKIALQELVISEKLDRGNCKKHIERIKREIIDKESYKELNPKEDTVNEVLIDSEIEKELSIFKLNYSSSNV
ncbi:hypothetical protein F7984_07815 [Pradoshia sp. D12]|uniref:hypothetical protein n=1 Tax=Bacillaceae TaxID=186817 RepID=UPI00112E3857|nr:MULTISPECIES: hypothetical protein [Bacillaceae]QFK71159.1 hypothetical protein F7984_07815 [Pradoshia sp. D12]TPF72952.1 hypothetical protein FHY44_04205 [Bacillus sp. D12]